MKTDERKQKRRIFFLFFHTFIKAVLCSHLVMDTGYLIYLLLFCFMLLLETLEFICYKEVCVHRNQGVF